AAQSTTPIIPQPESKLPAKLAPRPTEPAITAADLMTRLYQFADDSMQGRRTGTAGHVKGTDYIAREVERLGLVPAGDNGTWFQTLPFVTRRVSDLSNLIAGGTALRYGTEWGSFAGQSVHLKDGGIVFGGVVDDSARRIAPDAAAGKLVIALLGRTGYEGIGQATSVFPGAAAVALVLPDQVMEFVTRPSDMLNDTPAGENEPALLAVTGSGVGKLFTTPVTELTPGSEGKTVQLDLNVEMVPIEFPARNVVAILPGSDPALRGEYVAIGAHSDHVGFSDEPVDHDSIRIFNHIVRPGGAEDQGRQASRVQQARVNAELAAWRTAHPGTARLDSISNGADDDGSGSMSVLEIAEKFATASERPKRSLLFVWHVGEEEGLYGSKYFTDHPTVPRDSIVAQLNIDMVGRGDIWDVTGATKDGAPLRGNPDYLQLVGSRRLSAELGDLAETVNQEGGHALSFDYAMDANGHPMNIYCRSDHDSYARYGIPVIFFTTGGHSDYHQVTDEPQYINYDHMSRVDRFIADLLGRVANLDHRLKVDRPGLGPKAACQQ
ncbi:MAG: M28 family peptidase, partial [Gemmatimonadales bacterium]